MTGPGASRAERIIAQGHSHESRTCRRCAFVWLSRPLLSVLIRCIQTSVPLQHNTPQCVPSAWGWECLEGLLLGLHALLKRDHLAVHRRRQRVQLLGCPVRALAARQPTCC